MNRLVTDQILNMVSHKVQFQANINLIDLFYECEYSDFENYANDTTLYHCVWDINIVTSFQLRLTSFSSKVYVAWYYCPKCATNKKSVRLVVSGSFGPNGPPPKKPRYDILPHPHPALPPPECLSILLKYFLGGSCDVLFHQ